MLFVSLVASTCESLSVFLRLIDRDWDWNEREGRNDKQLEENNDSRNNSAHSEEEKELFVHVELDGLFSDLKLLDGL